MTKATGDGCFDLRATEGRAGQLIERAAVLGAYTYVPAPRGSAAVTNGALIRDGRAVTLRVTEPLLRDFVESMLCMEADLARRWMTAQGHSSFSGAE
ncbi:hypothetical protein AB0G64_21920 [Streptomyces longwoodensis]|uniref:hypothetical protein n=1 Tax=Streptomyces longwoodensis TaxID=68231 RepID=UPI0033C28536